MRNSNSRDKPASSTATSTSQNRLMKTQVPPKLTSKDSLNSTQYKLPPSNKRIESSKNTSTTTSIKQIKQGPKQQINFDIQGNMTESKIYAAKESLQLLKKKMSKTGMSRQKISNTGQNMQKTTYPPPESMKKIKSDSAKNIQNFQPNSTKYQQGQKQTFANNIPKYQQTSYSNKGYNEREENDQPSSKVQSRKAIERKPPANQPPKQQPKYNKNLNDYYNEKEQIPISKKQDFNALLERQLKKQENLRNISNSNSGFGTNKNQQAFQVDEYQDNGELFQCSKGCGRHFNAKVLPKHEKVCEKVFQSKRKVFNTAAQRKAEGEGYQKPYSPQPALNKTKKPQTKASKIPKWKLESAQLRAGLKAVSNTPLTAEEQQLNNIQKDSLVQCNCCGRKFNQTAAKRHIPICQNKAKQAPRTSNIRKK